MYRHPAVCLRGMTHALAVRHYKSRRMRLLSVSRQLSFCTHQEHMMVYSTFH